MIFVLTVEIDFRELIIKKNRKMLRWKEFWHILYHGKILILMWSRRNVSILWCQGCNWGVVGQRDNVIRKRKDSKKFYKQKYGLLMRNTHRGVLTCQFLEMLESGHSNLPHNIFQMYWRYIYVPTKKKHQNWRDHRETKQCWALHQLHLWKIL